MTKSSEGSSIPGLTPPELLIFFHIPKTGGITMKGLFQHCLPDQHFDADLDTPDSALLVRSTARIAEKFHQLPPERRRAVRCVVGEHLEMDVDRIFDRPAKFFTILRDPVDRAVSNFFFNRTLTYLPCYPFIKNLTLEAYLDSGIGLDHDNHQVRMLSGCPELDAPWDPEGRPISTPPVERWHLELAKRNIEDRFIVAATLDGMTALVWWFKKLYGWPLHKALFQARNQTPNRPRLEAVSEATRRRLAETNRYDIELYQWVKDRFTRQLEPLEPEFSREVRHFERLNRSVQRLHRLSPRPVRNMARRLLFST